jgi:cell division protein FtsN
MGAELSLLPRVQQVDSLFRVRLGPFSTHAEAVAARDRAQTLFSTTLPITSNADR